MTGRSPLMERPPANAARLPRQARSATAPGGGPVTTPPPEPRFPRELRAAVIFNKKARRNLEADSARSLASAGVGHAAPDTQEDLRRALADFAARGVDALVIDGGDGTVRDVATAAAAIFPAGLPLLTLVPSGKTNALALDLGIPVDWPVEAALDALRAGRVKHRAPIEIVREGSAAPDLRGFIFGAGAFVRATNLAQRTHRLGAFNNVAVALSIAGGVAQTLLGGRRNPWRRGDHTHIAVAGEERVDHALYVLIASTLKRMPLGITPFGAPRAGLKLLAIDAPPKRLLRSLPTLLAGRNAAWLEAAGYHRIDAAEIALALSGDFVLDGETFPGGAMTMRQGAPIAFAAP